MFKKFRSPINHWADLADTVAGGQIKNPIIKQQDESTSPLKPEPPLSRILEEDNTQGFCEMCGSSIRKSWFGKTKGCIQPLCDNFYLDQQ